MYAQVNGLLFKEFDLLAASAMEELVELIPKGEKGTKKAKAENVKAVAETTRTKELKAIAQDMVDELFGRFRLSHYYFFSVTRNSFTNLAGITSAASAKRKELFKKLLFGVLDECSNALINIKAGIEAFQNKLKSVTVEPFNTESLSILKSKNRRLEVHEIRDVATKMDALQFDKAYRYFEGEVAVRFDFGWRKIYDVVREHMFNIKEEIAPAAAYLLSFGRSKATPLEDKFKVLDFEAVWTEFISAFDAAVIAKATKP